VGVRQTGVEVEEEVEIVGEPIELEEAAVAAVCMMLDAEKGAVSDVGIEEEVMIEECV
jgi:hypothetical protein